MVEGAGKFSMMVILAEQNCVSLKLDRRALRKMNEAGEVISDEDKGRVLLAMLDYKPTIQLRILEIGAKEWCLRMWNGFGPEGTVFKGLLVLEEKKQ
jgi:hypothetical protein